MRRLLRRPLQLLFSNEDKKFLSEVKAITGITPGNLHVYRLAFLHSSLAAEQHQSNERLEFLGDAVLGTVIADYLFRKFPYRDEGYLTDLRSKMVSRVQLNSLANKMGIVNLVQYNRSDSYLSKKSIGGNALEALVGAIYLDGGYALASRFVLKKIVAPHLDIAEVEVEHFNYKSKLLEFAQRSGQRLEYKTLDHIKHARHTRFKVAVYLNGEEMGKGEDNNKKDAEKHAAKEAYARLGIKEEAA
ncbi:MAG TPA: ribonuclease III [Chitinophagales bacterium]|nr:ribonuclease III [Chitinophagales bacterium]